MRVEAEIVFPVSDCVLVFVVVASMNQVFPVLEGKLLLCVEVVADRPCRLIVCRLEEVGVTGELVESDVAIFEIVSIVSLEVVADQYVVVLGTELPALHVRTASVVLAG